jgi:hypothetical protein
MIGHLHLPRTGGPAELACLAGRFGVPRRGRTRGLSQLSDKAGSADYERDEQLVPNSSPWSRPHSTPSV